MSLSRLLVCHELLFIVLIFFSSGLTPPFANISLNIFGKVNRNLSGLLSSDEDSSSCETTPTKRNKKIRGIKTLNDELMLYIFQFIPQSVNI